MLEGGGVWERERGGDASLLPLDSEGKGSIELKKKGVLALGETKGGRNALAQLRQNWRVRRGGDLDISK